MSRFIPAGLGWQRDLPDPRDYTCESIEVQKLLANLPFRSSSLPESVDLRSDGDGIYFSPPADQGAVNSSTAFACISLVEYFQRRALGRTFDGSPMFLHRMSQKLSGASGNSGSSIRSTFKALRRYGVPPEEMWEYDDGAPGAISTDISLLGFSRDLGELVYFRLDSGSGACEESIDTLKAFLAAGFPVILGFVVPRSLDNACVIRCRPKFDAYRGGQVVLAVGFDDRHPPGEQGAILIRSSWGTAWGDAGYGWLPYSFVTRGLAGDLWTMLSSSWAAPEELSHPQLRKVGCSPL